MISENFTDVLAKVADVGKERHSATLLNHAIANFSPSQKSFKALEMLSEEKQRSAIIISAGPSLHKNGVFEKIKKADYKGTIVAVDGSLCKCLKNGIVPDYVLTLDPHPKRIARWFGDPNFEENMAGDDYFSRQDLDIDFRNNSIAENERNIALVDQYAEQIKLIICSSAPENVVKRTKVAKFDRYWWNPIVDSPRQESSLTRKIYNVNKHACMNTGGTVGTAAWVFANAILKIPRIALTGMDLGYHLETPLEMTQTYYELHEFIEHEDELDSLFPRFVFPLTQQTFYTDPTYYWYRHNFLQLLSQSSGQTINCSEAGTLFSDDLVCETLTDFLAKEA